MLRKYCVYCMCPRQSEPPSPQQSAMAGLAVQRRIIRVRRRQRTSTVNAPAVDRSVRRRNFQNGVRCVLQYHWSRQPPLGEREAFHGPPDYIYPAGTVFHSSRAGAATACSPCAYGRTCAVPRVEVTESSFISLTLYHLHHVPAHGCGPVLLGGAR